MSAGEPEPSHPHGFIGHEASLCAVCSPFAESAANGPFPTPSETRQDRIRRAAAVLRSYAEQEPIVVHPDAIDAVADLLDAIAPAATGQFQGAAPRAAHRVARSILGEPGDDR